MTKNAIFDQLSEMLSAMMVIDKEEITPESSLIDTLVMDSIQLLEFILAIEKRFSICIESETVDPGTFESLSVLVDYIDQRLQQGN